MGKTLDEMLSALPVARRRKVAARTAALVAEEMTLRELRKAMGRTQAELARTTGKPQATISRMEAQSDMLLSNLNQVVEAMGGRVRIMAELPDRPMILLTGLGDLTSPREGRVAAPRRGPMAAVQATPAKAGATRTRAKAAAEEAPAKPKRARAAAV